MFRSVSRRSQTAALIALVSLLSFARTSMAQTPRLEVVGGMLSSGAPAPAQVGEPQQVVVPGTDLDSLRIFKSTGQDAAKQHAVRTFVECHISRHPLLGIRAAELACPLLFAEAQTVSPPAAESQASGAAEASAN